MVSNETGQQLHGRAVRGETLSADEQAQLAAWYAEMDRAEMAMLSLNSAARTKTMEALHAEVDAELARITAVTKRKQKLSAENNVLRREIVGLQDLLAQKTSYNLDD